MQALVDTAREAAETDDFDKGAGPFAVRAEGPVLTFGDVFVEAGGKKSVDLVVADGNRSAEGLAYYSMKGGSTNKARS